jgi:hypothetical protein
MEIDRENKSGGRSLNVNSSNNQIICKKYLI